MAMDDTFRPLPDGADLDAQLAHLRAEAGRQLDRGLWEPAPEDVALARKTAAGLADAVLDGPRQEQLPVIDRLERLREALAVIAMAVARTHGQLAWFLSRAATVLMPVLTWRVLPADELRSFGLTVPAPGELDDAERAVRRLTAALDRIGDGRA
ncbi:hypothetical protein ACIA8O_25465 [Kitasatospora sp. NPDC051853]|uniref:hypothetical protein n=1 Tax=Kitasatospora sp. NPDC051853 TaxID=3364058 RepID=UPI0037B1CBF5